MSTENVSTHRDPTSASVFLDSIWRTILVSVAFLNWIQLTCFNNIGQTFPKDVDECQADPCVNGTCANLLGSYQCNCPAGHVLVDSRICLGNWCNWFISNHFDVTSQMSSRYQWVCDKEWRLRSNVYQHSRIVLLFVWSRLLLKPRVCCYSPFLKTLLFLFIFFCTLGRLDESSYIYHDTLDILYLLYFSRHCQN